MPCHEVSDWEPVIVLKGDLRLNKTGISLKAMVRALQQEGHEVWVESIRGLGEETQKKKELAENIKRLIQRFQHIFQEPPGLPPHRETNHSIRLKECTEPVSVRPFRYPHT